MTPPQLALVLNDAETIDAVARVMSAASSGLELQVGTELRPTLERVSPTALQLLVVDEHHFMAAVDAVEDGYPNARVVGIVEPIDDAMLASALRLPRMVGFLGRTDHGPRPWELAYVVRRTVAPQQPIPGAHELLNWGASTVTFRPRTTRDRDQAVQAVELVATRFGMSRRASAMAADASHELLMNAMYDAPIDPTGRPKYAADRQAQISLAENEVPTLRLTVDGSHLALDISDPFGRLPRAKVFGGLLRGRTGVIAPTASAVLDVSHGGAGLGMFNLFNSAAILRIEVIPGRQTLVSWILDRTVSHRTQRSQSRSLYFIEGRPNP
ncbi:MAG: hypothetical protein ABMB14_14230 [Myxococcota bacterium]